LKNNLNICKSSLLDYFSQTYAKLETQTFHLAEPSDSEAVVVVARQAAKRAGFKSTDEFMIAVAASELATNILRYAGEGDITISIINNERNGVEIIARDQGPGIQEIEQALQEGFSTTEKSLGMGLPSVKKIMDEFIIESSPGAGTCVMTRKWC
jgi:serine/threonine-protein kinase RsbT